MELRTVVKRVKRQELSITAEELVRFLNECRGRHDPEIPKDARVDVECVRIIWTEEAVTTEE